MESLIEYRIVANIYVAAGNRSLKYDIKIPDFDIANKRYDYLKGLLTSEKPISKSELKEWCNENLPMTGIITSLDGLFGVAYVKIKV